MVTETSGIGNDLAGLNGMALSANQSDQQKRIFVALGQLVR